MTAAEKTLVIYSPNEAAVNDGAGFWSNDAGWTDLEGATRFTQDEARSLNLPISTGNDARFMRPKQVRILIEAFATSEYSVDSAPEYAAFTVFDADIARMEAVQDLCVKNGLSSANYTLYPDWGPGNVDDDLRLQGTDLVVTANGSFWFDDQPKYGDFHIQSRGMKISALREAFESAKDGDIVVLGDGIRKEEILQAYRENCEDEEAQAAAEVARP